MKYFFVCNILIWLLGMPGARCDCRLGQHSVSNTNRIFMYRNDRNEYQLLRTEFVPHGMTLHMYCNAQDVVETICQGNQFSLALPMRCNNPMEPKVTEIKDSSCAARMYVVGYAVEGQLLELYRSCYDQNNGRVLHSESDVYYKSFFFRPPFVEFKADDLFTAAEAAAYMKSNIYRSFLDIFGRSQKYLGTSYQLVINRGHLVASADFLFVDQMSSTYRYLNIVPQFKSINDGNWEKIERWVRGQITQSAPFHIKTGGYDVLRLPDESGKYQAVYLYGSKLPVPMWTYKVVRDINGKGLYVFFTYNCTFKQQEIPEVPNICQPMKCPFNLSDSRDSGYTICCDPQKFPY